MGIVYGVGGNPIVTVGVSEIDIIDAIGQAFQRATVFVHNVDATATMTIRIYGMEYPGCPEGFKQIQSDITIEPAATGRYTSTDLMGDLKVRGVATAAGTIVHARTIWEPQFGKPERRAKAARI